MHGRKWGMERDFGGGRGLMTSGGRGKRAYHRHIWKACRGGWWAVFFSFMAKKSQISGETTPFFSKTIRQNSPFFWGSVSPVMAKSVWICVGDRHLASVATVQKWPNKKKKRKKRKKTGDGCDSQFFFFPPPPLVWCLLEMNDDSFRRQCRVEARKSSTGRGQTPDSRGEEELVRRLLYIYSRAPSSLLRLSLLAFD